MVNSTVEERVKKVVAEQMHVSIDSIELDTEFRDDLDVDSLDCVEMTMSLEEEFEIDISDDEAEQCSTVRQAIDLIKKLIS